MSETKVTSEFLGGSYRWTVYIGERNENTLTIHDQAMGRYILKENEIWDSDILKLVRLLGEHRYSHSITLDEAIKLVNKTCRHLKLTAVKNEYGGIESIFNLGDL